MGSRGMWFSVVAQHARASSAWGDDRSFANAIMGHAGPQSLLCELLQRRDTRPVATKVDQDVISCDLGSPNTGYVAFQRGAGQLGGQEVHQRCLACILHVTVKQVAAPARTQPSWSQISDFPVLSSVCFPPVPLYLGLPRATRPGDTATLQLVSLLLHWAPSFLHSLTNPRTNEVLGADSCIWLQLWEPAESGAWLWLTLTQLGGSSESELDASPATSMRCGEKPQTHSATKWLGEKVAVEVQGEEAPAPSDH